MDKKIEILTTNNSVTEKRLMIIIDAFTVGGAQHVLRNLIPIWVTYYQSVDLILLQNNSNELRIDEIIEGKFKIHRLKAKSIKDVYTLLKLVKLFLSLRPNELQAHLYWSQIWSPILKLIKPNTRLIWVEHNTYLNRNRVQWYVFKLLSKLVDRIIAVSNEVSDYLRSKSIGNVEVIFNPISEKFRYEEKDLSKPIFLVVSRLNEQKNVELAIRSFQRALEMEYIPNESTLIVGGDGPLRNDLELLVSALSLNFKVFFQGKLEESEVSTLFKKGCTLISTSFFEGFSLVRLEALSSGCTVVTTNTGGIKGILTFSEENLELLPGVFVVDFDIEQVATSLGKSLEAKYWSQDSIKERSIHVQGFRPPIIANKYFEIFKS